MQDTIRRMIKVLGGGAAESLGPDHRFWVDAPDGSRMKIMLETGQQRLMAELLDGKQIPRGSIDVAPIAKVTEDPDRPGRVSLHVGHVVIHLDSQPMLAISIASET